MTHNNMTHTENASLNTKRFVDSPFRFEPVDIKVSTALVEQLKKLPEQWALIPCVEKRPSMFGWEKHHPTRQELIEGVRSGDREVKKKWKDDPGFGAVSAACDGDVNHPSMHYYTYKRYYTGFGIKSGEASGGLLLIDIDGLSAIPLLKAILGIAQDQELPKTVSWSSGKAGRSQLMFQVSTELREALAGLSERFSRRVPMSYSELPATWKEEYCSFGNTSEVSQCPLFPVDKGEGLDFRYDLCQSLLPPSVHPTMGHYFWINSPENTPVMMLPVRIEKLMFAWIELAKQEAEASEKRKKEFERKYQKSAKTTKASTEKGFTKLISNDLISAIAEADQRAGLAGFDWEGHQFKDKGNGWLEGYCPVHGGESGTSFQVEDNASLNYPWRCHGCAVGGVGVNSYLLWIHTGQLKFKGHTGLIRKFLAQYGVTLADTCKSHDDSQLDELDRKRHKLDKEIAKLEAQARKEAGFEQRKAAYFDDRNLENSGYEFYTECEEYCSEKFVENMPHRGFVGLQAEMGKGKSYAMRKWLKNTSPDQQFIFIYSRIALGKSQARILFEGEDNAVVWIDDFANIEQFNQGFGGNKIALCYDSLHKLKNFKAKPGLTIVMDEVEAGLSHLLTSDTLKEKRGVNIKTFVDLLGKADVDGTVLIADASLRKSTVNYIKQFLPISNTKLVINTSKPKKRKIEITKDKGGTFEQALMADIANQSFCYLATDSKRWGQGIHRLAAKELKVSMDDTQILRLDRDTSNMERGIEAILETDAVILRDAPKLMIATPTLANGISIECNHFQKTYFYGTGTVTPIEAIQQAARVRKCENWSFHAKSGNNTFAKLTTESAVKASMRLKAESIKEMLGEYIKKTEEELKNTVVEDPNYIIIKAQEDLLEDIKNGQIPTMQHEHSWYMCKIIADANWARVNFYNVLVAELLYAGHELHFKEGEDTITSEKIKECILEHELEEAQKIAEAETKFMQSYETAKKAAELNKDPKIRKDGKKSLIAHATGLSNEEITKDYVMLDMFNREWRSKEVLRFYLSSVDVAVKKDMLNIKKKAKNRIDGGVECPFDDKYQGALVRYLEKMNVRDLIKILDLDNLETTFSVNTPGLEEWALRLDKISNKNKEKILAFFKDTGGFPIISAGSKKEKKKNGQSKFQRRYAQAAIWVLEKIGYKFEAKKGDTPTYRFHPDYLAQTPEREKLQRGLDRKYNGATSEQKQVEPEVQITEVSAVTTPVTELGIAEGFDDEFGLCQYLPQSEESSENFVDEFGLMQCHPF